VSVEFDGLTALDGVTVEVRRGEILGVIGPNGAGKTTLINVITGYQPPTHGSVLLGGRDVTGLGPRRLARMGLGRTFQAVRLFDRLTVRENVEAAALGSGCSRSEARRRVRELLALAGLADRGHLLAGALPYGDERRLAFARALATEPSVLMLDEPAAGLDERESEQLMETIAHLRDQRCLAVLVVEHDMPLIMGLCDRVQVLAQGRTIAYGSPAEVLGDPGVIAAYLGQREEAIGARG
jgi:branched-chain amino acid transport system ATP-binding protein